MQAQSCSEICMLEIIVQFTPHFHKAFTGGNLDPRFLDYLTESYTGVAQACPNSNPGITLNTRATDSCIEFELLEVPCDIRSDENNCIWKNSKNQCCNGGIDCSSTSEQTLPAAADHADHDHHDDDDEEEDIYDEL
ncbi:hypothetical protein N7517_004020 [Penicillium concentricum]|uniref:Uncharacterized protein n=1 Tax=Penicillium concentricum TaxID=293559 RepID=A0A9W9S6U4_9EURO|nr:uncharacterized protein N7517_004020 [Penicillium concentricum]KAJ5372014.1 hypothetical protein N7517_004020 [Penicillium concentricum]